MVDIHFQPQLTCGQKWLYVVVDSEVKVKVKAAIALPGGNPTSHLQDVTCHMGSHGVTCHPTQVNTLHQTPAMQVSTRFTYPGGWKAELT